MMRRSDDRPSRFLPFAAAAGFVALTLAAPGGASAESLRVGGVYAVTFSGVPIGRATFSLVADGGAYSVKIAMKPAAVGKVVAAGVFKAEAAGWLHDGSVFPARFLLDSVDTDMENRVSMRLADGAVKYSEAEPGLGRMEERVPITDSVMAGGILDPVSSAVAFVADPGSKDVCARKLPIFDGWTRYDIKLSYQGTQPVDLPTYSGTAVVCAARWVPVAGHIPDKPSVVYMKNNRSISISYVPVGRSGLMVPYSISMKTLYGTLNVEAEDLKMTGPLTASAGQ